MTEARCENCRTYRGWSIDPAYYGWQAIGPNYDASWEGEEDGWVDNGEKAWGRTREECEAAVDEWFDEHQPSTARQDGGK